GMCMAVTKAKEAGMKTIICASTGNTSASAAAYAAKAKMDCIVLIPKGKIALGKLSQAMMHGARVIQINGNFDVALNIVREIAEKEPIALVNSVNPNRIEGQKTGAFEIVEQLGDAPDYHFMPVGNAGNITAYWKGYNEYLDLGKSTKKPKMIGYQAEGAAPIVRGHIVENPETIATAIRIGNPASWKFAEAARDESGGHIGMVSDDTITKYQQLLAQKDGVFCEPACAVAIAGVVEMAKKHTFKKDENIVSIITGHGLKDPDQAIKVSVTPEVVDATYDAVSKSIFSNH
ncbi:MAG: threonine synthase, partial [Candidatus Margulisiibacteriota bacterium]|nr:threonine synthase [Candidatus Margulisiibacteriota bacterium]